MLACLFFHSAFSDEIFGIDLGTGYIKAARLTVSGLEMVTHPDGDISFPAAIALASTTSLTFPLSADDFNSTRLVIGAKALSVLARYPNQGYSFLPRALARAPNSSEFNSAAIQNVTALFTLFLHKYHSDLNSDGFVISVPFYWTPAQLSAVSRCSKAFRLPLIALVDDLTAMGQLYSALKGQSGHVLFVDVGATSVKAYGLNIKRHKEYFEVDETASSWSENTGGYFFAKEIAAAKGISMKKAQKFLVQSEDQGIAALFEKSLAEVENVVKLAKERAVVIGGKLDDIQLIGGGSAIPAVAARIRALAGKVVVRRDFRAREALARGALLTAMISKQMSPYLPIILTKRGAWSLNFTCTGTHVYCKRGEFCKTKIEDQGGRCDRAVFTADPAHIPVGMSNQLAQFTVIGDDTEKVENVTGRFEFNGPNPVIEKVNWCLGGNCHPGSVQEYADYSEEAADAAKFIRRVIAIERDEQTKEAKRRQVLREIGHLVKALEMVFEQLEDAAVERGRKPTEAQTLVYQKHASALKNGELTDLAQAQLDEILAELKGLKQALIG
jgi:molecular chaperone DnaK (HSP70)